MKAKLKIRKETQQGKYVVERGSIPLKIKEVRKAGWEDGIELDIKKVVNNK